MQVVMCGKLCAISCIVVFDLIAKSVGVLGIMVLLCNKHCGKKFENADLKSIATHNLVQWKVRAWDSAVCLPILALPGGEAWPKIHGGRSVERFIFSKQCSIDLRPSRTGRKTGTKMDQSPIGKSVTPTRKFWPVCWTNWNKNFCSGQISKVCIASSNYHPNCTPIFCVNFLHLILDFETHWSIGL